MRITHSNIETYLCDRKYNMPQVIRPSHITITNGDNGVGKLIITLELNINLNTNGVTIADDAKPNISNIPKVNQDDKFDFEIPDFSSGEQIKFGKNA